MSESAHEPLATLRDLVDTGELEPAELERIEDHLAEVEAVHMTPWFLQPLLFAGALLAAVMLSTGVIMALDIRFRGESSLITGLIYLAGAVLLHRLGSRSFAEHLALSCSIGGHAFVLFGAADLADHDVSEVTALITATLLCAALYGVYRTFLHRFFACLLVFAVAKFALPEAHLDNALHGMVALATAGCCWLLTRRRDNPTWRPLAYACGFGLIGLLMPLSDRGLWFDDAELPHSYVSSAIASLGLLWTLRFATARAGIEVSAGQWVLASLLAAGLASLSTPGIPAALCLVVLGHATFHWPITALGLASLPLTVWKYYYNLDIDLMTKSGVLASSGALLLLARWLIRRRTRQSTPGSTPR